MKLIRIINNDSFRTYSKDKIEKVKFKGKTYITSRYIDYPKTNVLTLRKQRIVKNMLNKGVDIEEIAKAVGVPLHTIYMWWSHHRCGVGDQD